ncbi:MAG: Holliday junction resolvase RuvX [Halieaceae bacterium]|nr:Holliday junction resolvase RuvX [Halieaceae bacterium]
MSSASRCGRVLAFDFGLRQIGVAVGNVAFGTSEPLTVLPAREGQPEWASVAALIEEWQPDVVLVGDPLNMDGSPSELGTRARKFARRLHGRFGVDVAMVDERLTSFAVKSEQREAGHRGDYHRDPVDSLAAALILRDWLNTRRTG